MRSVPTLSRTKPATVASSSCCSHPRSVPCTIKVSAIPAVAIPITAIWIKHRETLARIEAENNVVRTGDLEDRMKVIERIVTDRGYDVATQIEALRDQRQVEARLEAAEVERSI